MALSACGGDGSSTKTPDSFVGIEESALITVAEGGSLKAGAASLTVPAGAVANDVELSVKVTSKSGKPQENTVLIDIYDFGPDGTTFLQPVEVSFDTKGIAARDDGEIVVAWLDGTEWQKLPTTVKDGKASAQTAHFTPFTLIFVLDEDGQQTGGQCGDDFTACGGDLSGTWNFTAGCLSAPGVGSDDDTFASCTDKPEARITVDLTGVVTFGPQGAFDVRQTIATSGGVFIPDSCVQTIAPGASCADFEATAADGGCLKPLDDDEGDAGGPKEESSSGTYTVDGSNVTITNDDSGDDEPEVSQFCVTGNSLRVRSTTSEGFVVIYTAEKQ